LALLGVSAGAGAWAQAAGVLARVGDRPITVPDFALYLRLLRDRGDYTTTLRTLTSEGRAQILDALVDQRVLASEARARRVDRRPDLQFQIEQAAAQILAEAMEARMREEAAPTEAAARAFYAAHPDRFRRVGRVRAHQIVVKTLDESRAVLSALAGGASFEALAAERSLDQTTRGKGGDLGWLPRGMLLPSFEAAVFALGPGAVSAPIQTGLGFHVVRVDERDAGAVPPFEEIQAAVAAAIVNDALAARTAALRAKHRAVVNAAALSEFGK
jgi:peptidyl-prolyl cis-trans isomerase C